MPQPQNHKRKPAQKSGKKPQNAISKGAVAACPYAKKCGGCQLQNMDYERQLAFKQSRVVSLLGRYAHVEPILGMDEPYHYRNKVQAAFGLTRSGKVVSGVYQAASHRIVNVDSCLTEDTVADTIITDIREMLPDFGIVPYNEDSRKGFLRHVLVKRGFASGQVMVVLVGATAAFPQKRKFCDALLKAHPEITTVVFNQNARDTSMLLGEREEVLFGDGYIEDTLCGCRFRISAKSFYQINPVQTEKLYGTAMKFAALKPTDTVLDAYCGVGTIGLVAAKQAGQVIGVEVNPDAVRDARRNCRLNGAENAVFEQGDAGEWMTAVAAEGAKVDVVFMDPPRAGSDLPFLKALCTLAPERVVYISCNPETQARDLRFLTTHGYKVKKIQPVDMFPHTSHIECVVLLSRAQAK